MVLKYVVVMEILTPADVHSSKVQLESEFCIMKDVMHQSAQEDRFVGVNIFVYCYKKECRLGMGEWEYPHFLKRRAEPLYFFVLSIICKCKILNMNYW